MTSETSDRNGRTQSCLLCGTDRWRVIRSARDFFRPKLPTLYALAVCESCGLVAQQPAPDAEDLRDAYEIPNWPSFRVDWRTTSWSLGKMLRRVTIWRRLRRLRRFATGSLLLEVGCGSGDFLWAAHRAGWATHAVEIVQPLAEAVRSELGLDVRASQLKPGMWPERSFDAIAYWEVLEHVPDPVQEITLAARLLRPGGVLLLSFPSSRAAFTGRLFREYWAPLELPRHLFFFDRHTLSVIAARSGLRLLRYYTPILDTLWCYVTSLVRFASSREHSLVRWGTLAGGCIAVLVLLPFLLAEALMGCGPQGVAILEKPKS